MTNNTPSRRALIAVIGEAGARPPDPAHQQATALGRCLVDGGYRICSGGLTGVMTAVFQGARQSAAHQDGDTIAIIPSLDHRDANPHADIVIATGLGHLRNGIVAAAEAVIIVGGKAGTLSEMAFAWRYNRLLIALSSSGGVAAKYAGQALDDRIHRQKHPALATILNAQTPQQAIAALDENLPACYHPTDDFQGEQER